MDRAVSTFSGGAIVSSHLGNSFDLPCSGKPQCEICPFHYSFLTNPRTFPQDARWHPWSVSVFMMGSPLLGSRLFFSQHSIVMKTLLTLFLTWFRVFTMGSPFSGRGRNFLIAHSIRMKSLAEPCYQFLRDVVTLWVMCGPWSTLDREQKFSLVISLSSFRMRSPFSGQAEYNLLTIEGLVSSK